MFFPSAVLEPASDVAAPKPVGLHRIRRSFHFAGKRAAMQLWRSVIISCGALLRNGFSDEVSEVAIAA